MISENWSGNLSASLETLYKGPVTQQMKVAEIGCFEGFGTRKLHAKLCSHEASKLYCIDPWDDVYVKDSTLFKDFQNDWFQNQFQKFSANTKDIQDKLVISKGYSTNVLPTMEPSSFDLIYIDGDHSANQVYIDAKLSLPLVKPEGILLFDDYIWSYNGDGGPCEGIQRFINDFPSRVSTLFIENNQCALRVIAEKD
jgi:predicted O-methyltransferase YrrM